MRYLLILLLLCCLVSYVKNRPAHVAEDNNESEVNEAEYDDEEEGNDEALQEDGRINVKNSNPSVESSDDNSEFRYVRAKNNDNFSENKPAHTSNKAENDRSQSEYSEFLESNGAAEQGKRINDREVNNMQQNDNEEVKETIGSNTAESNEEEGDLIFEDNNSNRQQTIDRGDRRARVDPADNGELRISQQQNHKSMDGNKEQAIDYFYNFNRDRRQAPQQDIERTSTIKSGDSDNIGIEDEESAIKRHIKRLSDEELDELFNSLSNDKKMLLKKIIDSDMNSDGISKREITKKAGAVEENSLVESGQSDANKVQVSCGSGDTGTDNTVLQSTAEKEISKQPEIQTENNVITSMKSSEVYVTDPTDESSQDKSVSVNAQILNSDSKVTAKTEIKREANEDDYKYDQSIDTFLDNEADLSNDQYQSVQDEELPGLSNDKSQIKSDNPNIEKRDTRSQCEPSLSDSIKSLEQSFPNSDSYDDGYISDNAPLVRVKRKNCKCNKKTELGIRSDSKASFVPGQSDNGDDDNREGNEFDEEGFYDRVANVENKDVKLDQTLIDTETIEKSWDQKALGSDTDSVLSGVEGVDENLMFNSGPRNRRTPIGRESDNLEEYVKDKSQNIREQRSTPLMDYDMKTVSENHMSAPNYQEHDAFGPLPENYEGELARFKRIRRLKKPSFTDDS